MRLAEQMLSFPPKGRGACKIPEKVKSQRVRETERADLEGCARCGKTVGPQKPPRRHGSCSTFSRRPEKGL